ncbi:MAG: ABC transporter ATP-binding protein [Lachnospiraceae bacterium]|nr:ABC transporter ATP-binding protein [Lachnospiraceae bacterium]
MIEIKHLYKRYGRFLALNDFSLNVGPGELFGFVGSNGAGKTTTMRICVGLLKADGGEVLIEGKDMLKNHRELAEKVGYVPDYFGVYKSLTASEYLHFFASAYGIYRSDADKLTAELLDLVNLTNKKDTDVNGLSRGMKQRLCLARGLVHNPDILFLDEPASGLDPKARYELKEILKNLSSMGKTIIISSHILPELAEMCTSVGIIDKGHLVLQGSIEEIHRAAAMSSPLNIAVNEEQIDEAFECLKENPYVQKVTSQGSILKIVFTGTKENESELLASFVRSGIMVSSFYREEGSLESLFMQIVNTKPGKPEPQRR